MIGCLFTVQYKLCSQDNNWKQFVDSFKSHEKKAFRKFIETSATNAFAISACGYVLETNPILKHWQNMLSYSPKDFTHK